ncbi:n-terminal acetyltransferase A auxiliary subunit [Fusarium beomiforme]|uniref:N-terminal acetyltransferase A auxiliary subunit n=1 Tax=Fusarium beomiforme TaxID=44412 RepID=A0A9P5DSQ8_9HYPO|nr:n-terminal acetyltransferase A auxiliary subunit [Fusarium beomiforme]
MPAIEIPNQIAGLIRVTEDIIEAYEAIKGLRGLPEAFHEVNKWLPLIEQTLREIKSPGRQVTSADDAKALETPLKSCEDKADKLLEIFQKIASKSKDEYVPSVYRAIAIKLGKHRVETLMDAILKDLEVLIAHRAFEAVTQKQVEPLAMARKELAKVLPSLPDTDLDEQPGSAIQYGDGNRQYNSFGLGTQKNVDGNYFEAKGDQNFVFQRIKHVHTQSSALKVLRVIPLPRNEDITDRAYIFAQLETLLPPTPEHQSAALHGLGGSGLTNNQRKTQVALEYAYRRCYDPACSVFWVHAANETAFTQDYKMIARRFGLADSLDGEDLLTAVRDRIESRSRWLLILDNADDLALFGVAARTSPDASRGQGEESTGGTASVYDYVPRGATGTVLWTSRDGRIVGTLVGAQRGIPVCRMSSEEAVVLLGRSRNEEVGDEEADEARELLGDLQWLPLAISQAGAYMRTTSTTIQEYLSRLAEGKERWRVLKKTEFDRYRRNVPNSVLETWSISIERIRLDNDMAYKILHIIAYVSNQNIPFGIMLAAGLFGDEGQKTASGEDEDRENEDQVVEAVARLREFAFLGLRREGGMRRYEMHKLVQEATRYGLSARSPNDRVYFSRAALQIVATLFPEPERERWAECEEYVAHAVQVGEWGEICKREVEVSELLTRVSDYLYDRGRWREREPVDERVYELRKRVLGEEDRHTMRSMAELATTYHNLGRYDKAEQIKIKVLDLRRQVLGEMHPDTISSMASLVMTYDSQGRYDEVERIKVKVLDLRRQVLGETHPDTIGSMACLAATYHTQGRYDEAEQIKIKVLDLGRQVLGETHPDTIWIMASLATTYHSQGRYDEAEQIKIKVLDLRRQVLGEMHPDTISSMASLATTYHSQGRYDEAEQIKIKVLDLRRQVLGEMHPDMISSMASLATTYHSQGRYDEAEQIKIKVLDLRRQVLGNKHPGSLQAMHNLAITWNSRGRRDDAICLMEECLQLRRSVLGPEHPFTKDSDRTLNCWETG